MLFFIMMMALAFPAQAQDYLDPGTGSYITQLLIGSLIGGLYLFKAYFTKIIEFIKKLTQKKHKREKVNR